jgi:nicotinamidase-related amidase
MKALWVCSRLATTALAAGEVSTGARGFGFTSEDGADSLLFHVASDAFDELADPNVAMSTASILGAGLNWYPVEGIGPIADDSHTSVADLRLSKRRRRSSLTPRSHSMSSVSMKLALLLSLMLAVPALAQGKLREQFTPQNAAVLLIDHQKTTVDWVKSVPRDAFVSNVRMLTRLGVEGGLPTLVTTTMEETVGPTMKDIQELAPRQWEARVKRGGTINAFLDAKFKAAVKALGRKKLIVAGLTSDICLFHTVQGALREGYEVWVVADASGSMTASADEFTYAYLRGLGVTVTGGNSLLSELYSDFGTPDGQRAMKINLDEIVSKLK